MDVYVDMDVDMDADDADDGDDGDDGAWGNANLLFLIWLYVLVS